MLPGILVLFYRGPNVRATFEAKDSSVPWTDRVPAPVLALTLLLVFAGVGALLALSYGVLPLFGTLLTGVPAVLGILVSAALCAAAGLGDLPPAAGGVVGGRRLFVLAASTAPSCSCKGAPASAGSTRMAMSAAQLQQIDRMGISPRLYSNPAHPRRHGPGAGWAARLPDLDPAVLHRGCRQPV